MENKELTKIERAIIFNISKIAAANNTVIIDSCSFISESISKKNKKALEPLLLLIIQSSENLLKQVKDECGKQFI
jgi:hypothetical protein